MCRNDADLGTSCVFQICTSPRDCQHSIYLGSESSSCVMACSSTTPPRGNDWPSINSPRARSHKCAVSSELNQASSLPADSCSCMRYGPHQGHHTHSTHGPYCFLIQAKCIFTLFSGRTSNLDLLSCEQRAPPSSAKSGRVCDILQTCFTDDNVQCKI